MVDVATARHAKAKSHWIPALLAIAEGGCPKHNKDSKLPKASD